MRGKWGSDIGLSARMLLTMILLGLVYVVFIGIILLYVRNIAFVAIFVALFLGAQYYFSDRIVLAASGAHIVSEDEAPELHSMIERLCAMADLPKPKVAIANSAVPNAFATGRSPQSASVAVTAGLLGRLNRDELQGVIAHEMSHILHRDILYVTLAGIMLGSIVLISQVFLRSMFYSFQPTIILRD